jgi:hypothetical protein
MFGALAGMMLAAAPAMAADPVFPINSRIGMVPPPGFTPSTKFTGFENPQESAAILLLELPPEAYAEIEKGFTDTALKARGMLVETREPVPLNEGRGFFVSGPQETGGAKRYEIVMVATLPGVTRCCRVRAQSSRMTLRARRSPRSQCARKYRRASGLRRCPTSSPTSRDSV